MSLSTWRMHMVSVEQEEKKKISSASATTGVMIYSGGLKVSIAATTALTMMSFWLRGMPRPPRSRHPSTSFKISVARR